MLLGVIEYFEWVGKTFGDEYLDGLKRDNYQGRRLELKNAMLAIHAYEIELSRALLSALEVILGLHLYGLTDPDRLEDRVLCTKFRSQGFLSRMKDRFPYLSKF